MLLAIISTVYFSLCSMVISISNAVGISLIQITEMLTWRLKFII